METLWSVRRPVRDLRPGDHAWLAYSGEEERRHVTGAFVREGLAARDKVLYLTGSARDPVPGAPPDAPAALLTVLAAAPPDGAPFDPRATGAALAAQIARARRDGFRTVRVAADLTFALARPGGLDPLLDLDQRIERAVAPSTHVTAVCQVDRRRCRPADLAALRAAHAVQVTADPEFEDPVLCVVRTFQPAGLALAGELDASRHAVLDQALAAVIAATGGGDVHLDMSGLTFMDLGAIHILADTASRHAWRGRLVLDRVPAQLHAVLETVGSHMVPGLSLGGTSAP